MHTPTAQRQAREPQQARHSHRHTRTQRHTHGHRQALMHPRRHIHRHTPPPPARAQSPAKCCRVTGRRTTMRGPVLRHKICAGGCTPFPFSRSYTCPMCLCLRSARMYRRVPHLKTGHACLKCCPTSTKTMKIEFCITTSVRENAVSRGGGRCARRFWGGGEGGVRARPKDPFSTNGWPAPLLFRGGGQSSGGGGGVCLCICLRGCISACRCPCVCLCVRVCLWLCLACSGSRACRCAVGVCIFGRAPLVSAHGPTPRPTSSVIDWGSSGPFAVRTKI